MSLVLNPTSSHRIFHYSAFGLQIASEVDCPELVVGSGDGDVLLRRGEVPRHLFQLGGDGRFFEVDGSRFLMRTPDGVSFLVEDGRKITVDATPEADSGRWRIYLFGSAFGALLHQRGRLPLHGSALLGVQGAFVLAGASGIGKSTLAAVLHARGLPVLSDDVCAVSLSPDSPPLLHPAYPRLHLCPDVLDEVGASAETLRPARKAIEKYAMDVHASFPREAAPLKTIFLLESADVDQPCYEEFSGMRKVVAIAANTYRPIYLRPMGRLESHFRQVAAVARSARLFRIQRPEDLSSLRPLADLILRLEALPTTPA